MSASLLQTQQLLQRHLLDPALDTGDVIAQTDKVPRAVRLNIYANAYRVRLVEAASADFSALHLYLGDEAFEALIHAYLEMHPSRNFSLRPFGAALTQFLRDTEPYAQHAELHELAAFEWALCHAFDAADAPLLDAAALAALAPEDWPQLRLALHPSMRCLQLHGNIGELWSALNAGQQPPALEFNEDARTWLVWRQDLKLLFRLLNAGEAVALRAFQAGADFGEACELLAEHIDEDQVPLQAVGFLQQWLREGLIVEGAG